MKIQTLLEQNGVQFVSRSYGMVTKNTITLNTLEKIEHEIKSNQRKKLADYLRQIGYGTAADRVEIAILD